MAIKRYILQNNENKYFTNNFGFDGKEYSSIIEEATLYDNIETAKRWGSTKDTIVEIELLIINRKEIE